MAVSRCWSTRASRIERSVREVTVHLVRDQDLTELLPLVRAYCDFYEVAPTDAALIRLSRALIADPEHEGLQLIARDGETKALGFATVFWTWSTLSADRIGVMNDLYVVPDARGLGVAEALIEACRQRCRERGVRTLSWQTAKDNRRAQAVYERVGATREEWLDYSIGTDE
jgi:GNAT superfamily N-acetyltransferase